MCQTRRIGRIGKRRYRIRYIFNNIKIWISLAEPFYTMAIDLAVLKQDLETFIQIHKAFKMVFEVRSIRVFSQFLVESLL